MEASDRVLMMFDQALQGEAVKRLTEAPKKLLEQGLIAKDMTEVLLKVEVKEVKEREITLSDGRSIPYGLAVWAAGNGPLPLIQQLIKSIPEQEAKQSFGRGRLVTDEWMRVKGAPGLLSIGDCCVIDDTPLPANAQVSQRVTLGSMSDRLRTNINDSCHMCLSFIGRITRRFLPWTSS